MKTTKQGLLFSFLHRMPTGVMNSAGLIIAFMAIILTFNIELSFAQSYDDWFYNPFNKNSAIHRPIGTGAIYASDDDSATITWLQHTRGMKFNYEHPYGAPFAAVDETDPVKTVNYAPSQINRDLGYLPVSVRVPAEKFPLNNETTDHFPDGAVGIYDRTTGLVNEFYNYRYNDGYPLATIHRAHDIKGLGHGTELGERVGVMAAGGSVIWGSLQPWELEKPDHVIGHALQMVLPRRQAPHSQPQLISKKIQWPATNGDGTSHRPEENNGFIPYGGLMAIPPMEKGGPDLNKMGLSPAGLRLAQALRDYGAYVIDGGHVPIIRTTGNFSESLYNQLHFTLTDDLNKIYREMRLVKNSVTGATAEVIEGNSYSHRGSIGTPTWPAGGGTPLAPNTAIDAKD